MEDYNSPVILEYATTVTYKRGAIATPLAHTGHLWDTADPQTVAIKSPKLVVDRNCIKFSRIFFLFVPTKLGRGHCPNTKYYFRVG